MSASSGPDPLLLSICAAARELGIGRDFTYGLVRRGEIGTVRVGGKRLVPRAELARWVEANTGHTDEVAS